MTIDASSPTDYLNKVPADRKAAMEKLRDVIANNIPPGFVETMVYGMIGYAVPLSDYPQGYHVDGKPLPFMNIASQKNFIAVYHMAMYADPAIHDWFVAEYPKHSKTKLDMGKSCIRFKKPEQIPFELIGQLAGKISMERWIALYEKSLKY